MKILVLAALVVAGAVTGPFTDPVMAQAGPALPGATRVKPASAPGEVSRSAPVNGVLTLFGNERCPTNQQGEEIVVCVRRSAEEQYRVPKELREFQITPENESWAVKAQGALGTSIGTNGIGSCSTVGPGGATGCFNQRVKESRSENVARSKDVPTLP